MSGNLMRNQVSLSATSDTDSQHMDLDSKPLPISVNPPSKAISILMPPNQTFSEDTLLEFQGDFEHTDSN